MSKIKNIILDLDNTLISAEALEDFPFSQKGIKDKVVKFELWNMDNYYIVFERPYLQEFLDFIFEHYNVSVWTAATKDYALFVIKHILLKKPNRKLDWIMFSYHCKLSKNEYNASKHLNMLWSVFKFKGYNEKNTLIIDDYDEVYNCQPENAIHIKAFEILDRDSEKDDELLKIKKILSTII